MDNSKKMARVAGLCYLLIFIGAGLSYGYVQMQLFVPGDTAATARNMVAAENALRWCIAGSLTAFVCDVVVAAIFYRLLKPVSALLSLLAAFFRLVQTAVLAMNTLNLLAILFAIDHPQFFNGQQNEIDMSMFIYWYQYGFDIAMIFFGMHCILLAWLLYRSERFPNLLALFIALAAITYLMDSYSKFLLPSFATITSTIVGITAVVAELALCIWLLVWGVRKVGVPK